MDKVFLIGRFAKDPEVTYTSSGKARATFSLAVNPYPGAKDATFIPIIAWDNLAEIIGNNLSKGRQILVEGYLQNRSYDTENGKKYKMEVVAKGIKFLDGKKSETVSQSDATETFADEEIPF